MTVIPHYRHRPFLCPPSTSTSMPAKVARTTEMQTPPFERFTAVDVATSPFEKQNTVRPIEQISTPLTAEEEKYLTELNRIKSADSDDKMTVRCKTGGQPLLFRRIIKPRKKSSVAPSPLKKTRANQLNKTRMTVSGDSSED